MDPPADPSRSERAAARGAVRKIAAALYADRRLLWGSAAFAAAAVVAYRIVIVCGLAR
jgi:hypothetical protein